MKNVKQIQVEIIQNFNIPDNYTLEHGVLKDENGKEITLTILPMYVEERHELNHGAVLNQPFTILPIEETISMINEAYYIEDDMESQ